MQRQNSVVFHPEAVEEEPPRRLPYLERNFPDVFCRLQRPAMLESLHLVREDPVPVCSPSYTAAAMAFAVTPQDLVDRLQTDVCSSQPVTQEWSDEEDHEDVETVFFPNNIIDLVVNVPCRLCARSQTIVFEPLEQEGYYVAVLRPCICASFCQ